ncbi:MAG TPA: class I SAM-dependent methyltransferase [Sphingomicrobium sp.]|nr:class I SAM-dependent methyltransferase [Sphingomicrobium sp.]
MKIDPGSFRDPSGRILRSGGRIFRAVYPHGAKFYGAARDSGVLAHAVERGRLLPLEEIEVGTITDSGPAPAYLLEHPCLDFVSYPYEWTFSALKAAALLQLDFHIELLADGFSLSDATAYNVQFIGTRPVFIDHLSVVPYDPAAGWAGQRQFAMQYLGPLLLWSKRGIAPNGWFRGSLEGIAPEELAPLLRWRDKLSFNVLAHILGPAAVHRSQLKRKIGEAPPAPRQLPKARLEAMLKSLRSFVAGLAYPGGKTVWDDYADCNSYDSERRIAKHAFVARHVEAIAPRLLFDVGCNSGDFSQAALAAGAKSVVGFDFDFGALERAFSRFSASNARVLPLWLDATNPSPSQGWAGRERLGLAERSGADMLLALALIHHLAIAKNVPLDMAVDWLMSLAPSGIIEFPSKGDPMVQELLRARPDIFPDYSEEAFLAHVAERGAIVEQTWLGEGGRLIVAYRRG